MWSWDHGLGIETEKNAVFISVLSTLFLFFITSLGLVENLLPKGRDDLLTFYSLSVTYGSLLTISSTISTMKKYRDIRYIAILALQKLRTINVSLFSFIAS